MRYIYNSKYLYGRRKDLRNNLTSAEALLWRYLKKSGIGIKFRRQYSIGKYIVDFYCPALRLAVELDGGIHNSYIHSEYDTIRADYIQKQNIRILRFYNSEVFEAIEQVLEIIRSNINTTPT